jgi:hypothetical protein
MISTPMVRLTQTVHLPWIKISIISEWTELSIVPHHQWVPSGVSKWFLSGWYISRKLCTYLALTLTLSTNGKKRDSTWPTSPRGSNGCVQNDFWAYAMFNANRALILRHDLHYLQTDQDFTWASSPRCTSGSIQNDFWANGMFVTNCTPILYRH